MNADYKDIKPTQPTAIYRQIDKGNPFDPKFPLNIPIFTSSTWTCEIDNSMKVSSVSQNNILDVNYEKSAQYNHEFLDVDSFIPPIFVKKYKIKIKGFKFTNKLPDIY